MPKANVHFKRSVFDLSFQSQLTLAPNMLTPIFAKRVEPGETLHVSNDHFLRFNNLLVPVFDRLKVGIFAFYVRDRDVYRYAPNVYGEVSSPRTKNIVYRSPYICSSLAPWFIGNVYAPSDISVSTTSNAMKANTIYDFAGRPIYTLNTSTAPTAAQKQTFKELMSLPIKLKQNGLEFNVPPAPFPLVAANYYSDNDAGAKKLASATAMMFNDTPFTWHPGGLGDYLYGSVGSKYVFYSAYKALAYFKIFDDYFRPADLLDPLFAVDEHHENVINRAELARLQNLGQTDSATTFGLIAFKQQYNALCDNYSEEQIGISQVMATNLTFIAGQSYVSNVAATLAGGNDFKSYLLSTGGLCPVFKYPDYFGLAGLAPSEMNFNVLNGVGTANVTVPGIISPDMTENLSGSLKTANTAGTNPDYTSSINIDWDPTTSYGVVSNDSSILLTDNQTIQEFITKCKLQQFMDMSHLSGTRYFELLRTFGGVDIPDNQLGRPVLLSMDSSPFDIIPVVQSSATGSGATPQGTLTANGVCRVTGGGFYKTFMEHGIVMILVAPRSVNIYQERLKREDLIFERLDYRYPVFSKLGEQPIYNAELHLPKSNRTMYIFSVPANKVISYDYPDFQPDATAPNYTLNANKRWPVKLQPSIGYVVEQNFKPFGYNERYAELKYSNNEVHGLFRSRAELMSNVVPDFQMLRNNAGLSYNAFSSLSELYSDGDLHLIGDFLSQFNGTQDYWTYAYDYDMENQYSPFPTSDYAKYFSLTLELGKLPERIYNEKTNTAQSTYQPTNLQSDVYFTSSTATPPMNWTFLLASTPWRRSSVVQKQQPLQMLCRFKVSSAVPYPVRVVPGQNKI